MESFDPAELEMEMEGMPEVDDDVQVGREEEDNPRYNGSCMNPRCNGTIMPNGSCSNPSCNGGYKMNPSGSVISWRNLRLSAAIMSSKQQALGRTVATIRRIPSLGMELAAGKISVNKSIRNIPELLPLATAEHWFDYIRNMSAIDVGAELSAEVSPQEQLAVYHFLKEWEMDPSHRAFRNRVNNSADIDSELTKGQIVYDIMTSRGPNPLKSADFSKHRYDKMFKLALWIY